MRVNMDKWTHTLYLKQPLGGLAGDGRALATSVGPGTTSYSADASACRHHPTDALLLAVCRRSKLLCKCPHCLPWRSLPDIASRPNYDAGDTGCHWPNRLKSWTYKPSYGDLVSQVGRDGLR